MARRIALIAAAAAVAVAAVHALRRDAALPPSTASPEPIIGILATPIDGGEAPCVTAAQRLRAPAAGTQWNCFTTFYAKWLESAGARVVAIPWNADAATLSALLDSVNGVLFTGGGLNLTFDDPYVATADAIFRYALAANDAGDFFPLHGTCMGMQLLSILAAHNTSVLSLDAFDSENVSWPLVLNTDDAYAGRLIGTAPGDIVRILTTQNVTENLHHDGVYAATYDASAALTDFYLLVSTNADRRGAVFVSTLEARDYPITAIQWHAERPAFEHKPGIGLTHTLDAVMAMQYVANFVVEDARRSSHAFPADGALFANYSLYGFSPVVEDDIAWGYTAYVMQL